MIYLARFHLIGIWFFLIELSMHSRPYHSSDWWTMLLEQECLTTARLSICRRHFVSRVHSAEVRINNLRDCSAH